MGTGPGTSLMTKVRSVRNMRESAAHSSGTLIGELNLPVDRGDIHTVREWRKRCLPSKGGVYSLWTEGRDLIRCGDVGPCWDTHGKKDTKAGYREPRGPSLPAPAEVSGGGGRIAASSFSSAAEPKGKQVPRE